MNNNWKHKDVYTLRGTNFCIEVVRWNFYPIFNVDNKNKNVWNLYVYIYPEHQAFSKYENEDSKHSIPFHGGCTFYQKHNNPLTGDITSIQIGCDYTHYMDDQYKEMITMEDAASIFYDAEYLFNKFENYTE